MLPVLAATAYLLLLTLGVGLAVERWGLRVTPRLPEACVTGMAALTAAVAWTSLVLPVNGWVHALGVVAGLVGLGSGLSLLRRRPPGRVLAAGAVAALAIGYLAAGPPRVYDTGFYHAQAVRWINEYPAVPGVANLHGRLAFNSSWFVWGALWDHGPLDGRSYHGVGAAFWLVGWALWVQAVLRLKEGGRASDWVQLGLLVPLCRFEHYAASLSPELPVHVLLVYAFALLLRTREEPGPESLRRLVLIAALLPTLKLSMAPALLLIPTGMWLQRRKTKAPGGVGAALFTALVLLAVMGPFVLRNAVLSGYLLYPFERLDLLAVDWKVPAEEVRQMRLEVRGWAIEPWVGPSAALRPVGEWLGPWLGRNLRKHLGEMALLFLGLLLGMAALARKAPPADAGERRAIVALPLVGLAFWFASAPDVRFGFSWLAVAVLVPAALLAEERLPALKVRRGQAVLLWSGVAWVLLGVLRWSGPVSEHPWVALKPLPRVEMRSRELPGGLTVSVPAHGDRAWDAPLPNTPLLDPGLRLRGRGLRDGFRPSP